MRASHSPLAMINAPPPSVHASGVACQNAQSSTSAQARALYSKGAMAAAWPWRKASAMAIWPRKPLMAKPVSTHVC